MRSPEILSKHREDLTPGRTPCTRTIWCCLDPATALENLGNWNSSCPCRESNPDRSVVQSVAQSRYLFSVHVRQNWPRGANHCWSEELIISNKAEVTSLCGSKITFWLLRCCVIALSSCVRAWPWKCVTLVTVRIFDNTALPGTVFFIRADVVLNLYWKVYNPLFSIAFVE